MKSSRLPSEIDGWFLRLPHWSLTLHTSRRGNGAVAAPPRFRLFSAGRLSDEDRDLARGELLAAWEGDARRHVQEARYIPRLVVSAIVFLAAYFFMSLVVRDPIPMIDEIVIALCCAAAAWVLMLRSAAKDPLYRKLGGDCSESLRSLTETEDEGLDAAEAYIERLAASFSPSEMADALARVGDGKLPEFEGDLGDELRSALRLWATRGNSLYRTYLRHITKCSSPDHRLSGMLLQSATGDGLDLYLLKFLSSAL